MNPDKLKHLEFIQNVITRMNTNSFLIKGWTITLVSALFALAAAKDANWKLILISVMIVPVFWILDGFYISQERQYRGLYGKVAAQQPADIVDFSMDATAYNTGRNTWLMGIVSKTLLPFYGTSAVIISVVVFVLLKK